MFYVDGLCRINSVFSFIMYVMAASEAGHAFTNFRFPLFEARTYFTVSVLRMSVIPTTVFFFTVWKYYYYYYKKYYKFLTELAPLIGPHWSFCFIVMVVNQFIFTSSYFSSCCESSRNRPQSFSPFSYLPSYLSIPLSAYCLSYPVLPSYFCSPSFPISLASPSNPFQHRNFVLCKQV